MQHVVLGLLLVAAIGAAPVVVFLVATRVVGAACRLGHRLGRPARRRAALRLAAEPIALRPLEVLAADLRRLHPAVHSPAPGTRMPKQRGLTQVYDERLVAAAEALDVRACLLDLPIGGVDREIERVRVEQELLDAGLQLRPVPPPGRAA